MNKRLLSFILAVAMVCAMVVMPVSADPVAVTAVTEGCPCGCGSALSDVQWQTWDPNTIGVPPTGHYYLNSDYEQAAQLEIISGNKIVLDLRGHRLTTDDYHRLFLLHGYLAVMDTVGGGRFSAKTTGAGYGGIIMVSNNETNDATFEFLSGTMMPDSASKGSRRGGMVQLGANTTFRMYGGRLMNGTTVNGSYNEPGGAIAGINSSVLIEILGGEIIGCESSTYGGAIYNLGTTVLKNCSIIGNKAASSGGNICQNGGSLTIENCTIADGVATTSGGNIYAMTDAAVTVKDSIVRNGYAGNHGGNLYMGTASGIVENTEIFAGVAANRGNNIYGSATATTLTVKDCQLPGDVAYIGQTLTLEGQVKIGLLNNGLRLWYDDSAATLDASGLTDGSEIYLDANADITGADAAYFKGAMRTVLTQTETGFTATQAAAGEQGGYCPHCGEAVVWKEFSLTDSLVQNCLLDSATDEDSTCTGRHIASGHYYLPASMTGVAQHYVGAYLSSSGTLQTNDVVIDLNGCDVTTIGRFFYLRPKDADGNANYLSLMDSVGGGAVTGSGASNQGGGVIYNEGSVLNIFGGKYVYTPSGTRNVTNGGVVYNGGTFNMHGGILDGSAYTYTDQSTTEKTYTYYGGALYMGGGSTKVLNMTAGRMIGGTAQSGGTAFFSYNDQVNISGGQFTGGTANVDNGGNIRLYSTGSSRIAGVFNLSNASITDGTATTAGGNLFIHYYTTKVNSCYIDGGTAGDYGGNISCGSSSTDTFTDCQILNGNGKRGANFYVGATTATANLNNCLVTNGTATTYAGNLYAGNGYINIRGGEISFGTAATYGGNIAANAGNYSATSNNYTRVAADDEGNVPLIAGGTAGTYGGNIYLSGVLYLDDAQLIGGTAATSGNDLYMKELSKQSLLSVGSGVTGEMSAFINSSFFGEDGYGAVISNTACNVLNARITLEGDYKGALLCSADGKLSIGAIAVVDAAGAYTWYVDAQTAIAQCPADGYVRLYTAQDVVLTKDCAVDICGQTVNISGAYTLYGMDSSGDDFTVPAGKVIAAAETAVASSTDVGGKQYIAVTEAEGVSFHRIQAQITDVALRPSAAGLYFIGSFGCDETVSANIESYGIAVSTENMPGADLMTDSDTHYTEFAGSTMENGASKTSVLVSDIMKDERSADLNSAYGKTPVFATAYLKLKDGSVVLSDTESSEDDVAYSLYDLLVALDRLIMEDPINYRPFTNSLRSFYTQWEDDGMGDWDLNKIPDPGDNGIIDVLFIGGSFNYYYVEELYGLAEAAGIPMRVCNLYYSGAGPKQHWTWWKNGESPCQFFNTDGNGRVKTDNVSLEWALAQAEWDVLTMQYPSGTVKTATAQEGFDSLDLYSKELSDYLHEQFPDAMQCWGQVWAYQVGYDRDGYTVPDRETQLGLHQRHKELAYLAAAAYDRTLIPCGEAWEFVRQDGYDTLCARLGKGTDHEGDYYHEGDIGGGQYLNACVWFEMITGESCVGNTYVPTYVYNDEDYELLDGITVEALQSAAHQAVEDFRAQQAQ